MAIKVMADNNVPISTAQDAALYNVFANGLDFVIGDIGDEMVLNNNSTSLNATLSSGECVICGRHITITGNESISLLANSSGFVVVRYDLSQTGNNLVRILGVDTVRTDNLNDNGIVHDLVIGEYITNASGISSFIDRRNILHGIPSTILSSDPVGDINTPVYIDNNGLPKPATSYANATVGVANNAVKLQNARSITLSGAISGTASFDGSENINIETSMSNAPTIYSGTTSPATTLGKNGDIFILYTA